MSSNRNFICTPSRPANGYTRDDVMRIATDYKNKRIQLISETVKLGVQETGVIGEVVSKRVKMKRSQTVLEHPSRTNRIK